MPFPTTEDYSDVLNMPPGTRSLRCGEAALDGIRDGTIEGGKHYLHRDVGQYAAVYRCVTPQGGPVALRCLLQAPPPDVKLRCVEQQAYLKQNRLPYFVESGYHEDAIQVRGTWYPVFTMDWVQGVTLHAHVQRLCANGKTQQLSTLASGWEQMLRALKRAQIAHGDLHPLNVLVRDDGGMTLVDYDTLFVPALRSLPAPLSGCEGYVHPKYLAGTTRPFNEDMDDFGGAVVLLSLRAFAADPKLFGCFSKDNLLFSGEDLSHPDQSKLFDLLEKHPDRSISQLSAAVREECRHAPDTGILNPKSWERTRPTGVVPDLKPEPRTFRRNPSGLG